MNEKCGEFHQKIEDALIAKCNEVPYCKVDCGKAIRGSNICQVYYFSYVIREYLWNYSTLNE